MQNNRTGWTVVFAGFGVNVLVGITYAWSIFARGLVEELGWSHAEAAAPYTIFLFCYAFSMIPAGRLQDRLGPRPVVSLGAVLGGAAFILCALFLTPAGVALLWGGLLGIAMACCFASVTPAAVRWFGPERKGLVAGIVVTGIGVSALILAPMIDRWVERGVAYAFVLSGIILFAGVLTLAQLIRLPPNAPPTPVRLKQSLRVLAAPRFYLIWVMFFLTTSAGVTVASHLDTLARVHADIARGYIIVSLFALFNAGGRIVSGYLSDRIGRENSMTVAFSTILIAMSGLLIAETPLFVGVAVAILGASYGGLFSLFPAATVTYFGERGFGLTYGLVFSALGVAGISPWIAGFLFEQYGSFRPAMLLLAAMSATAVALSRVLRRASTDDGEEGGAAVLRGR